METFEAILTRRSVPKPDPPAPTREQIARLLEAAVRAPTHHLTQPWRFVVMTGDALRDLGDAWAEGAAAAGDPDPEVGRAKALRAPAIMCVIEQPHLENRKVIEVEEHHAVGAAMQNILLAAHDMGLGAMLRTGPPVHMQEVRDHLKLADDELIAGLIYLGQAPAADDRPPTARRDPADITEWRGF